MIDVKITSEDGQTFIEGDGETIGNVQSFCLRQEVEENNPTLELSVVPRRAGFVGGAEIINLFPKEGLEEVLEDFGQYAKTDEEREFWERVCEAYVNCPEVEVVYDLADCFLGLSKLVKREVLAKLVSTLFAVYEEE